MIRLTDKLALLADVRLSWVMRRRRGEGRPVVDPAKARCVLAALVNRSDQDGCCHPSLSLIGAESDVPLRTVQSVLAVLVDEGIVLVHHRNHARGSRKSDGGSCNLYRLDWKTMDECRGGGARAPIPRKDEEEELFGSIPSSAATARDLAQPPREFMRSSGATSGAAAALDHAQREARTCAADPPIMRSSVQTQHYREPEEPDTEPPPYPPEGGKAEGGEGDARAEQRSGPSSDRQWAELIRQAYPCHRSDSPLQLADEDAVVQAIASERQRAASIEPSEILAAARQVAADAASGRLRSVLRLRVWAQGRGYVAHAEAHRASRAASEASPPQVDAAAAALAIAEQAVLDRAARQAAVAEQQRRRQERDAQIDAELEGLTAEDLDALRARIAASEPTPFGQRHWQRKSVRTDPALRQRMAELHRSDRVAMLVHEGAAA